jgi:dephospho-CoA kinase
MKLYGLTGGIASGKSAVTAHLRDLGYAVIDLDQIAREVVRPGTPGLGQLIDTFGAGYMTIEGELDRKKLADLVFNDARELARLDNLMGPLMWAEVERQRDELVGDLAFLDAALLIEKRMHEQVDGILLVKAPLEVRVRRAMERDGATEAHVRARMKTQMDDAEKSKFADHVIVNDGTLLELHAQVRTILEKIRGSV